MSAPSITGISHVDLSVTDLEASVKWYTDLLAMVPLFGELATGAISTNNQSMSPVGRVTTWTTIVHVSPSQLYPSKTRAKSVGIPNAGTIAHCSMQVHNCECATMHCAKESKK